MKDWIIMMVLGVGVFVGMFIIPNCPDCPEYDPPQFTLILKTTADTVEIQPPQDWVYAERSIITWSDFLEPKTIDSAWIWFRFKSDSIPQFKVYFKVDTTESPLDFLREEERYEDK